MTDSVAKALKNLVIEWRFAPQLAIYSTMDQVGLHFVDKFPDWQRSPLTLELRNKSHRRRFFMSYRRCFFDVVTASDAVPQSEVDVAHELFEYTASRMSIREVERLGFRQWFAFSSSDDFATLVERSVGTFHPQPLKDLLQAEFDDIGYVVDMRTAHGWRYNLRAGPMKKEQWFAIVPHEREVFDGAAGFSDYKAEFPSQFLYIDIDCFSEKKPRSELRTLLDTMRRDSQSIAEELQNYFFAET